MKRKLLTAASLLLLCISLSACGGKTKTPEKTVDGSAWDESWYSYGSMLGVEKPEGCEEIRNEGVVTSAQTYYTVWAAGDPITYKNTEDTEVTTYDVQLHLLAEETKSADAAVEDAASWASITAERYEYTDEYTAEYAGQSFDVCVYEFPEDGGPASAGASATGVRGEWAFHVDVIITDGSDPKTVIEGFLNTFHYAK